MLKSEINPNTNKERCELRVRIVDQVPDHSVHGNIAGIAHHHLQDSE